MVAVVIVEDDAMVGRALQRELRAFGADSRLILEPNLVAAALADERPLLIISDLRMPGCTGIDILAMARARLPLARRCLLTGTISDLREADVALIEPCTLLRKPWHRDDLAKLLEGLQ